MIKYKVEGQRHGRHVDEQNHHRLFIIGNSLCSSLKAGHRRGAARPAVGCEGGLKIAVPGRVEGWGGAGRGGTGGSQAQSLAPTASGERPGATAMAMHVKRVVPRRHQNAGAVAPPLPMLFNYHPWCGERALFEAALPYTTRRRGAGQCDAARGVTWSHPSALGLAAWTGSVCRSGRGQ